MSDMDMDERISAMEKQIEKLTARLDALDVNDEGTNQRDISGTTTCTTERAWAPTTRARVSARAFGFTNE